MMTTISINLRPITGYRGFFPCEAVRQVLFVEEGWSVTHILWADLDGFLFEEAEYWWSPKE
jgi:hypothetical protein